ncbi:MAG: septum formation protein Maf [Solirubrobacteraceae bacterium]|nr:septum formation protein Maf [Solirubrobacteraceae bacterium]
MPQAQPNTDPIPRAQAQAGGMFIPPILASASPQRTAILTQLGIAHRVIVADVDEVMSGEPDAVAEQNARAKAHAVARSQPFATVIGSDTIVLTDEGEILGKPADLDEAREMLGGKLLGRTHTVVSGLALAGPGQRSTRSGVDRTTVRMRTLSAQELERHLAHGEWEGRAGAYAIQGRGAGLVEAIEGDYLNVVGLPVALMARLAPDLLDRAPT